MEDNEPESQSLSLQVQETARWAKVLSASCKGGSPEPGGQQGRQSPQSSRAEPPAANVKGEQCGMAALWCVELGCLSSGLEPVSVTPWKWWTPPFWVYSVNVLAPLLASVEFPQKPICGWCRSADMATLTTCADMVSVSSYQTCLLLPHGQICLLARWVYCDLGNFPFVSKCCGWLTAILVDVSDCTLFYILYDVLIRPMPRYWSCSPHPYAPPTLFNRCCTKYLFLFVCIPEEKSPQRENFCRCGRSEIKTQQKH